MNEPEAKPKIAPWTIWIPIIMMALGIVVFYNYALEQSMRTDVDRPPYITRLEKELDGLTERSGKQVKLSDLRGKVILMAHVYTTCPMGCSSIVEEMKKIFDEFGPTNPTLQLVSFAIDPGDGPPRLKQYAEGNEIKTDQWWFLNGDQPKIRTYLSHEVKFYPVVEKPKADQTSEVDKYTHDMRVALIDHAGHLRGMYEVMNPDPQFRDMAKAKLRKDLKYLLADQAKETAAKK